MPRTDAFRVATEALSIEAARGKMFSLLTADAAGTSAGTPPRRRRCAAASPRRCRIALRLWCSVVWCGVLGSARGVWRVLVAFR
jgi:hypothetical protein